MAGEIPIAGVGTFSGEHCQIELRPAADGVGIFFRVGGTRIPCTIDRLLPQDVHTSGLGVPGARFRAFEHLLAAFHVLGIRNCEVVALQGDEVPDPGGGSCGALTTPIRRVGIRASEAATEAFRVVEAGSFSWEHSTAVYEPADGPHLELRVAIDFPAPIGQQEAHWSNDPASGLHDVASFERARSFLRRDLAEVRPSGDSHWVEARRAARGLPDDLTALRHMAFRDGEWVVAPRFPAEPAWHKLADLAGDLLLLGRPLAGRITVERPGHAFNHRLVHHLLGRPDPDLPLTAALH